MHRVIFPMLAMLVRLHPKCIVCTGTSQGTKEPAPQIVNVYRGSKIGWKLVPKKGLEPPHPCEYVDLNHARLPIPPLRHLMMLRRESAERAATLSLANALYGVKFRRRTRAGNLRPGAASALRLHQLRVQHDLCIVREQLRNRATRLRICRGFIENFFRRARNTRRRVQHNPRHPKTAVNFDNPPRGRAPPLAPLKSSLRAPPQLTLRE